MKKSIKSVKKLKSTAREKESMSNPALSRRVSCQRLLGSFILHLPINQQSLRKLTNYQEGAATTHASTHLAEGSKRATSKKRKSFVNLLVDVKLLL